MKEVLKKLWEAAQRLGEAVSGNATIGEERRLPSEPEDAGTDPETDAEAWRTSRHYWHRHPWWV
jgi:hypothetical protein